MRMVTDKDKRYRHEIKYLCNENTACYLSHALAAVMEKDLNVCENGRYLIDSLYFDDFARTCAQENVERYKSSFQVAYQSLQQQYGYDPT